MADSRGFFKVTNSFPEHPKVEAAGGDAGWLWVCAMGYCSRNFTDGMIPIGLVPRLSDRENPKQLARILLDVGLWHAAGHDCKKCVQPDDRHYLVHDYLEHQTSAEKAQATSRVRAIAGQKGGRAKAASKLPSNLPDAGQDDASSKSVPEVEVEQEEEVDKDEGQKPTSRKRAVRQMTDAEPDPESAARDKLAREVLAWWWEQLDPKPAGKNAFHVSLRVINNLLAVGHEAKSVAAAARAIGTPLTIARMEVELGRIRTANGAANGHPGGVPLSRNMQILAEARARLDAEEAAAAHAADNHARTIQGEFSWSPATP